MTAVTLAPAWVDDDLGYSEFYQRYHRPLTGYLRMGFRDADVEAVAQETFCRALAHWSEVRHMAAPWPWLAVTARNLARNNIRDEQASRPAGLEVFHPATCSREDVLEQVEASDSLRKLAQAMAVLTPLQRRLVTVMVEEGLTGAELARRLGMRPGAVRMHLCRMRLRLGERFASLGGMLGISPVAALALLRRFRAKAQSALAGPAPVTLSAAVAAVGLAVIGLVPASPFLFDGATHAPQAVSVTHATPAKAVAAPRRANPQHVSRPAAPAAAASDRVVIASTGQLPVAAPVRAGTLQLDKRGGNESATEVIRRCAEHLTVTLYTVRCEGSGTGTQ